ncbi:MAG: beta-glucosidase [Janthinobacterium lividum]
MSTDDKLAMVFSRDGGGFGGHSIPAGALGSAAFLEAPAHLHLPTLQISDAGLGVGNPHNARKDGAATAMPSGLSTAASWDTDMARQGGAMIGEEAWRQGFNVLLAGGADLARDPRDGRNYEYAGEDPLLTGRIVGATVAGVQSRHVMSTVKHFAMNDLETSRMTMSADIAPASLRESDLLGFEIAIETGHPGSVMCSYNRVNDLFACENPALLNDALKRDWRYPGFVMSDWGGTHSTVRAALAGLDQESSGDTTDARPFFGAMLADAARDGSVPMSRLDDMARRVLRSIYAVGLVEHPPVKQPLDVAADRAVAQRDEEEGAVLLRNEGALPLSRTARIAVIGGHADVGVLSGGGSSQVVPIGGNPVKGPGAKQWPGDPVYDPSSPLRAMRHEAPGARIDYASGQDVARAVALARQADVVVLFATQWSYESVDVPSLSLPDNQDALIAAVEQANPHVVVVLETNGAVLMPWLDRSGAVLEAWYPGAGGGEAIARLLYGTVAPSGHLPMTFPALADQLAHPTIAGVTATSVFGVQFHTDQELIYNEGSEVGYRWFDRRHATPLFPFGHGLTYTMFVHDRLALQATPSAPGQAVSASFEVRNTGKRSGTDVAQIYAGLPDGGGRRLVGWQRVTLAPGETCRLTVDVDPRLLARFDDATNRWAVGGGTYRFWLASSATDSTQPATLALPAWSVAP